MTGNSQRWLILIMSLSGNASSARMRIWRALRGMGAAVLRDGVYLLPASPSGYQALQHQAAAIQALGGKSLLLEVDDTSMEATEVLPALFCQATRKTAPQATRKTDPSVSSSGGSIHAATRI